jgi:putative NIF3 family GTP cyclohydrolase 1 type 2
MVRIHSAKMMSRLNPNSNTVMITVRVAAAPSHSISNIAAIKTVAICAGSGSSVLSPVKADLYFSGEMGHHDVLAALAQDTSVILCKYPILYFDFLWMLTVVCR